MDLPFVRTVLEYPEVDSTSDEARRLVRRGGIDLPLLVVARRQVAGRGRGANSWHSDEGSLTATVALDPRAFGLRPEHEPRLALAAAVALIEVVSPTVAGPQRPVIRWPNDVECAGRKLAGLLPERVETTGGPVTLIGLGLNLTTDLPMAPPAVRRMAVSLAGLVPEGTSPPDRTRLLASFLAALEPTLRSLAADSPALAERWNGLDGLVGQRVTIDLGAERVEGIAAGIDARGGLRVAREGGIRTLFGGRVLRDEGGIP